MKRVKTGLFYFSLLTLFSAKSTVFKAIPYDHPELFQYTRDLAQRCVCVNSSILGVITSLLVLH